jgi:uncharacterized protein
LDRLIPPWSGIRVLERSNGIHTGARTVLSVPVGPLRTRWIAEHVEYEPNRRFRDVQIKGPFANWDHLHLVEPAGARLSDLEDRITYALPLGRVGRVLAGRTVRRQLERTFLFRHRTTCDDLAVHAARSRRPLKIGITGVNGLIGAALRPFLTVGGHDVVTVETSPDVGPPGSVGGVDDDTAEIEGLDALIYLDAPAVGPADVEHRFVRIADPVESLRELIRRLGQTRTPPRVLVNVSDTQFYGARGYERLDESAPCGADANAEKRRAREYVAEEARALGIRVVNARVGIVLTAAGGVLRAMLRAARAGFLPVPGDGRQFVSWIGLDDLLGVLLWAVTGDELDGSVNVVAPTPVTGAELASELLSVTDRFARRPRLSAAAARAFFPRAVAERLANSTRVPPGSVIRAGYEFRDVTVESALRHTLGL